ncbi:hypothetical protein R2E43_22595 [Streptomyces violaceoruber]|uniref:Uncharacterized protein n=1 Tax=Streptomyces violaceoruber TaxID=1935 RepID=A0ACD4WRC1_STRVN|nr:hypothetical protein R2E43_22595 [Streptomyces violaceoruber]BDD72672.1 hypothetical protein JCM4020_32920 [Streptomyces coelicolor]
MLLLIPGTNLVSGSPVSAFPEADFNWFPFTTTGLVSIPLGFACGWLGTMLSGRREAQEQRQHYEAVEGWILAGAVRRGTDGTRHASEPGAPYAWGPGAP